MYLYNFRALQTKEKDELLEYIQKLHQDYIKLETMYNNLEDDYNELERNYDDLNEEYIELNNMIE